MNVRYIERSNPYRINYNKLLKSARLNFNDEFDYIDNPLFNEPFQMSSKLLSKIGIEEINPNVIIASVLIEDFIENEVNITGLSIVHKVEIHYKRAKTFKKYTNKTVKVHQDYILNIIMDFLDEENLTDTSNNEYMLFTYVVNSEVVNTMREYRYVLVEYSKEYLHDSTVEASYFYDYIKTRFHQSEFEFKPDREDLLEEYVIRLGREILNNRFKPDYKNYDLYDRIHNLSLLKYEGGENRGQILFCGNLYNARSFADSVIEFKNWIPLSNIQNLRAIRKLLEISNDNIFLICDDDYICGIGRLSEENRYKKQASHRRLFSIKFKGQGNWQLRDENDIPIMNVSYGVPSLPKPTIDKKAFIKSCNEVFDQRNYYDYDKVWNFVNGARKQKHGTMVVINQAAREEAERLNRNSFFINPEPVSDLEFIYGLTSIDGAVMLDPLGRIHSIGCILDGVSEEGIGNISRGARFNSAMRYINYCVKKEMQVLVVIISEDGMIDIKTKDDLFEQN